MHSIEEALYNWNKHKEELIKFNEEELNEATTRLRIIDTIFIDVLGWPKAAFANELTIGDSQEMRVHKKLYIDYYLSSKNNRFLVEAKRNSKYFELPGGHHRVFKSSASLKKSSENRLYIEQATNYMNKVGVPFCVLCNGHQFIILRHALPAQEKDSIVFRGFDDIENNFILFWNLLSPISNGVEHLDTKLNVPDEMRSRPFFEERVTQTFRYKSDQNASGTIRVATEAYLDKFFSDLSKPNQRKLLKECYCDPTGRFKNFAGSLKDRMLPKAITDIKKLTIKDRFGDFGNFEKEYISNIDNEKGAVYVLVGEVGSGKSTFINHFYHFELDEKIRESLVWIHIDFLDFTGEINKIDEYITHSTNEHLNNYIDFEKWEIKNEIYADEINRLIGGLPPSKRGDTEFVELKIYEYIENEKELNKESHLQRVVKYLKDKLEKKICLVFDNTDQKAFEEQSEILMHAYKRADNYNSIIITAVRLETYFTIKNKPPFDAYQHNTFRIEPPKVKELLKKRLIASEQLSQVEFRLDYKSKAIKIPVRKFVKVLDNTLELQDKSVEDLLENLASGDMRRALKLFKRFVQSGSSRLYEILHIARNLESAVVDYKYVFDSIACGDNKYYDSRESDIKNLFIFQDDGFYSHFSQLYILKYLEKISYIKSSSSDGYVLIDDLYGKFSSMFISKERLMNILDSLLQQFLINSDIGARREILDTTSVCISDLGKYYLNELIVNWKYLMHVTIDTPLTSDSVFKELRMNLNRAHKAQNKLRIMEIWRSSIEIFLDYLEQCEQMDLEFISKNLPSGIKFPVDPIMQQLKLDFIAANAEEFKAYNKELQLQK